MPEEIESTTQAPIPSRRSIRTIIAANPDDWRLNVWANMVAALIIAAFVVLLIMIVRDRPEIVEAVIEAT